MSAVAVYVTIPLIIVAGLFIIIVKAIRIVREREVMVRIILFFKKKKKKITNENEKN
jgi:hypothetical protein